MEDPEYWRFINTFRSIALGLFHTKLVSAGCHNNILQTEWLNNRNLSHIILGAGKSKIKVLVNSVSGEDSSRLWDVFLLSVSLHFPNLHTHMQKRMREMREREREWERENEWELILPWRPTWFLLILITSQRPHLQISSHWGLTLQHVNFEGCRCSVQNTQNHFLVQYCYW